LHQLERYFVVMYTGAHGLSNDLGIVLSAARLLLDRPAIRFVFVGDGKEKSELLKQAERDGLSNVLFLPSVGKLDMPEVLAASDACVAILKPLELYKTTYPNKVFDAMAAGKPVLLAIDGVIRTVVDQAQAGIFCQPGDAAALVDAVVQLEQDRASAKIMGENGRRYLIQHFSRTRIAEDLIHLLNRMTKSDE
jgi:glycosyltransferase involved in cell wall biosynthesis